MNEEMKRKLLRFLIEKQLDIVIVGCLLMTFLLGFVLGHWFWR